MSSVTTNYGLYKANPVNDGADNFNIDTLLNENLDKIDAALTDKSESDHSHSAATFLLDGFMMAANKVKLDGITAGASMKITTGSYVGTGTEGSRNKNQLTFPFPVKLVLIGGSGSGQGMSAGLAGIIHIPRYKANALSTDMLHFSICGHYDYPVYYYTNTTGTRLYWYQKDNDSYQLNASGVTYYYTAIG